MHDSPNLRKFSKAVESFFPGIKMDFSAYEDRIENQDV